MSECRGSIPITAKVDEEMRKLLDDEADIRGVYRAEVARDAFDAYRKLRQAEFQCPHCNNQIQVKP